MRARPRNKGLRSRFSRPGGGGKTLLARPFVVQLCNARAAAAFAVRVGSIPTRRRPGGTATLPLRRHRRANYTTTLSAYALPGTPRAQHACAFVKPRCKRNMEKKKIFFFVPTPGPAAPLLGRARARPCFELPTGTHAFADGPGRADVISPVYQGRGYSVSCSTRYYISLRREERARPNCWPLAFARTHCSVRAKFPQQRRTPKTCWRMGFIFQIRRNFSKFYDLLREILHEKV